MFFIFSINEFLNSEILVSTLLNSFKMSSIKNVLRARFFEFVIGSYMISFPNSVLGGILKKGLKLFFSE